MFVKRHEHYDPVRPGLPPLLPQARADREDDRRHAAGGRAASRRSRRRRAPSASQEALFCGLDKREEEKREVELDARLTVSDSEVLQKKDFAQMTAAEIAAAKQAIARLALPLDLVRTRRLAAARRGHMIDMRRTLRASLKAGGAVIDLKYLGPRQKEPPIVALLDISGSMSQYTRLFLHFLHALTEREKRVATFLFGTRLTNVTRAIRAARSRRGAGRLLARMWSTGRAAPASPPRCASSTSAGRAACSGRARWCC